MDCPIPDHRRDSGLTFQKRLQRNTPRWQRNAGLTIQWTGVDLMFGSLLQTLFTIKNALPHNFSDLL